MKTRKSQFVEIVQDKALAVSAKLGPPRGLVGLNTAGVLLLATNKALQTQPWEIPEDMDKASGGVVAEVYDLVT